VGNEPNLTVLNALRTSLYDKQITISCRSNHEVTTLEGNLAPIRFGEVFKRVQIVVAYP